MNATEIDTSDKSYNYAGFWIRSGAAVVDSILILLLTFPLLYSIYGASYFNSDEMLLGVPDILVSYGLPFMATILFWIYKSATPGKMIVKVKIIDFKTGLAPTIQQSIIRYIGYYVATIPLGLGIFWVSWDDKKQGWHDKMAGTVVIRLNNDGNK